MLVFHLRRSLACAAFRHDCIDGEAKILQQIFQRRRRAEAVHADDSAPSARRSAPSRRSTPSSTETRAVTLGGSTLSLYAASCCSKSSHEGMLTTRALMPSPSTFRRRPRTAKLRCRCPSESLRAFRPARRPERRRLWPRRKPAHTLCDRASADSAASAPAPPAVLQLHDNLPRLDHFVGIARPQHDQIRHRPQRASCSIG